MIDARRRAMCLAAVATALYPVASPAQIDGFPSKPVRIIVPFTAGALTDIIARIYAEKLGPNLGQPLVVDNRPGAGGIAASQLLLSQPADGHTMLFVSSAHGVNPSLQAKLPYDTLHDFSGLALLATSPTLVIVNANHPAKTLKELIAIGKRKPDTLSYGSAGVGAATHLVGEYFANEAGIKMLHVPYKGVQEAVSEVMGGRLDTAFPPIALALPYIKAGRVRALGITSPERAPQVADVLTVAEQGLTDFEYSIWYAIVMSAKTPKSIMEALSRQLLRVSQNPDVAEKLGSQGLIIQKMVLSEFDAFIAKEVDKLGRIVKLSGAKPE